MFLIHNFCLYQLTFCNFSRPKNRCQFETLIFPPVEYFSHKDAFPHKKRKKHFLRKHFFLFSNHFLLAGFRKLSQFFLRCLIQILRYLNLDNCIFIPMDILIFHRYNAFAPQTDLTSGLCTRTDTADHVST